MFFFKAPQIRSMSKIPKSKHPPSALPHHPIPSKKPQNLKRNGALRNICIFFVCIYMDMDMFHLYYGKTAAPTTHSNRNAVLKKGIQAKTKLRSTCHKHYLL